MTRHRMTVLVLLAALAVVAGCAPPGNGPGSADNTHDEEHSHDPDAAGGDTVPADAAIRIVSPASGDAVTSPVEVVVEVDGVGQDHLHWHLYADGELSGMISGLETSLELPPGKHELHAALATMDDHEEAPDAPHDTVEIEVVP